jgi:hypothetical protein
MNQEKDPHDTPSLRHVIGSVLAAGFGVQSQRNRERDFRHGRPGQYILIGLIFTIVFVLSLWGLVRLVLSLATG